MRKWAVERAGHFGVSVPARGQEEISNRFAGREAEDADRFAGLSTATLVTGAPLLYFDRQYRSLV